MTAAVESEAAKVLIDWFSLFSAAPVRDVGEGEALAVDDMFVCRPNAAELGML